MASEYRSYWNVVGPPAPAMNTVIVHGRLVPSLLCIEENGMVRFFLDGRFIFEFPREWAGLAASMAAQAMAIGAGYSHFGAETKDHPFASIVKNLDADRDH